MYFHLYRNGVSAVNGRTNVCGGMTNCTNVTKAKANVIKLS